MKNKTERQNDIIDALSFRLFNEVADGRGISIPYGKMKILQQEHKASQARNLERFDPKNFGKALPPPRHSFTGEFGRVFTRLGQASKAVNKKLNEENIFFSPYFHELTLDILGPFSNSGKSAIEIYSEVFADKRHQQNLISQWSRNRHFSPRMKILEKALAAHANGDYELTVPTFLAQIEGVLSDILGVDGHAAIKNELRECFEKINNEKVDDEEFIISGKEILLGVICEQVFKSHDEERSPRKVVFDYPNRHRILHGRQLDYCNDFKYSTRCIVLLDYLRSEEFLAAVQRTGMRTLG